jgi:hypothetical protein
MRRIKLGTSGRKIYTAKYLQFRGVDMSTDPMKVDSSRAPYAPNLIADAGGFPEKRIGWRTIHATGQPVHGLYRAVFQGEEILLAHCGTNLYRWDTEPLCVLDTEMGNVPGAVFWMNKRLWILSGGRMLWYDGENLFPMEEGYIPTTSIRRTPAGEGKAFESRNLLQPARCNRFLADGKSREYILDAREIDAEGISVWVDGNLLSSGYTVDAAAGKIIFTSAPAAPEEPGTETVTVQFSKTIPGEAEKILGCTIAAVWNTGNADRVFLSGNPDFPAMDFASARGDPTYFPESGCAQLGTDNTAIMGYHVLGDMLAIVKEENQQDSTIFLRSLQGSDDREGESGGIFTLKQGAAGAGAISKRSFVSLSGDPLFLSRRGIFGISANRATGEQGIQNRSYFVDAALTKEENLEKAVAVEWNGAYLLCVNGNAYLLDGRQAKVYRSQAESDYIYECFHWKHIPASCFLEFRGQLYFGTEDGRICRFNDDDPLSTRFSDDGEAISCCLCTKADDDGDFMRRKTMLKQGSGLMIKPYTRSSVEVFIREDWQKEQALQQATMDIFDWNDVDFTRFAFNTGDGPQVIPFSKRVRNYIALQFILQNRAVNEGFGVFGIIKRYCTGSYVKK